MVHLSTASHSPINQLLGNKHKTWSQTCRNCSYFLWTTSPKWCIKIKFYIFLTRNFRLSSKKVCQGVCVAWVGHKSSFICTSDLSYKSKQKLEILQTDFYICLCTTFQKLKSTAGNIKGCAVGQHCCKRDQPL